MQVNVLAFVQIQRQYIDAYAAPAIRRLLEARNDAPARVSAFGDVREDIAGRGRRGRCTERKSAGAEGARQANNVANDGSGPGVCEKRRGILI